MNIEDQIIMAAFDDELEKIAEKQNKRRRKHLYGGLAATGLATGTALALGMRGRQTSKLLSKSMRQTEKAQATAREAISSLKGGKSRTVDSVRKLQSDPDFILEPPGPYKLFAEDFPK